MSKTLDKNIKNYALRLLSVRGRSEAELRRRINQKGFSPEDTDLVIEYLKEHGFVNDRLFAKELVEHTCYVKSLGARGCINYMRNLEIDKAVIEEITFPQDKEFEKAKKLLEKKRAYLAKYEGVDGIKKLYGFLQRRGFDSAVISEIIKQEYRQEDSSEG
ncbi:MAG: recombination regulator RecX [Candidatus Magnetoovum sp. WYHC-5]|nr:recombination regulator RecX [Candidatus Magnetoovum sp. WYHC-5]